MISMEILWTAVWKSSLAVIFAAAVATLLRRSSAAHRHLIWTAAVAAALVLPALQWLLPPLPVEVIASQTAARTPFSSVVITVRPAEVDWPLIFLSTYLGVMAVLLLRWAVGAVRVYRIAQTGNSLGERGGARLIMHPAVSVPMAFGFLRPAILLPESSRQWSADRLRVVLAHELAHIRRGDLFAHALAHLACALYWFNPLMWWAAARLRDESEAACDDAVIASEADPADYADHLVSIARAARKPKALEAAAMGMARLSQLESRLCSILDTRRNRRELSRAGVAGVLAAACLAVIPLAAMQSASSGTPGLRGAVRDVAGVVPDAALTLTEKQTGQTYSAVSNAAGQYSFDYIPKGNYLLEIRKPGFTLFRVNLQLSGDRAQNLDHYLELGQIREEVTVQAQRPEGAPVAGDDARPSKSLVISGNVQAAKLIRQVRPSYPPEAKAAGIQGPVHLRAVITMEGKVSSLRVLSSPDPVLTQAAMDAVQQWEYSPTHLNGKPVEIITVVTINFTLAP